MTVRSVRWRASWIAIEPTPPAPPTMRMAFAAPGRAADVEAVEEHLPGGDRGEREGCGLGEVEAARLGADDALVDEVQLSVGTLAGDGPGVEHLVAGPEEGGLGPAAGRCRPHRSPAPCTAGPRAGAAADLGVDRVHRDGADPDQEVAAGGDGVGAARRRPGPGSRRSAGSR